MFSPRSWNGKAFDINLKVDSHSWVKTKCVYLAAPPLILMTAITYQGVVAAQRWPHKNVTFREEYRLVRNRYRSAIDEAKTEYYSGKVQECAGDQKKLFEIIKSLTKPLQQEQYPDSDSLKDLADAFGDFFIMKIQKIRTKLDSQDPEPITILRVAVKEEDMFLSFQPLTEDDVRKLIKQSPNKQCSSDPIPTWLLKECLDSLLPVLTLLVNKSLQIGYFPEEWKNALVKPLLKKLGLELVFPSFRPVSNLPFISKLTEKASVNQLSGHMNKVRSLPSDQSAFRPFHSTETALLKVQSDILLNMDGQKVTLVMLDLSAAFDSITPTPYMMFPLFATRFAAYAGGILVSFIQPHLFLFDIICSAWEIYHTNLYGWNWQTCFPCMRNLGRTGVLMDGLLWF